MLCHSLLLAVCSELTSPHGVFICGKRWPHSLKLVSSKSRNCTAWNIHIKPNLLSFSSLPLFHLFLVFTSPSPSSACRNLFISASIPSSPRPLCTSFLSRAADWTWHRWLDCGVPGKNCPVSTRSSLGTCKISSTHPGTWPSTETCWAARACSRPSSRCSQWSRRTSPSYMKVEDFVCLLRWSTCILTLVFLKYATRLFSFLEV